MKRTLVPRWLLGVLLLTLSFSLRSTGQSGGAEREYSVSEPEARAALKQIGAFAEEKLPMLDGFAKFDERQRAHYARAFYTIRVSVQQLSDHAVVVRPLANISAWYEDVDPLQSSYRSLPSTGRLEADLLDRLSDYLKHRPGTGMTAEVLQQQIATLRSRQGQLARRRTEVEQEIAQMEEALTMQAVAPMKMALLRSDRARVFSSPDSKSKVLVTASTDDEFQIVDENDAWVRVKIEQNQTGWLPRRDIRSPSPIDVPEQQSQKAASSAFNLAREVVQPFEGEWKPLRGKNTLFLFTETVQEWSSEALSRERLSYALKAFHEHGDGTQAKRFEGIVIIFPGGIAAATSADIKQWKTGRIRKQEFLKRCSLDPLEAFASDHSGDEHPRLTAR